ncbi:hypothetical protein LIA77_09106 [Sarocladium implicatum]|nr:hypothetical protein LIA77_09106 [Sarocladium implicatum]
MAMISAGPATLIIYAFIGAGLAAPTLRDKRDDGVKAAGWGGIAEITPKRDDSVKAAGWGGIADVIPKRGDDAKDNGYGIHNNGYGIH